MRHYEIVILFDSDLPEKIEKFSLQVSELVEQSKGVIHRSEDWGRRPLAYPIAKHTRAHYWLFNVEISSETLSQVEEKFRFTDLVLRSLITKMPHAVVEPSVILKQRNDRPTSFSQSNANERGLSPAGDESLKFDGTVYESDSANDK